MKRGTINVEVTVAPTPPAMLKSFLVVSLRKVLNNKGAAWLNILCLTLGLATCLFIFNYLLFELSFDRDQRDSSIFRVESVVSRSADAPYYDAFCRLSVGPTLRQKYPFIRQATRLIPFSEEGFGHFLYQRSDTLEQKVFLERVYYAENSFPSVFPLRFLAGDKATALQEPNSLLLSQSAARQIFREEMAGGLSLIGRELKARHGLLSNEKLVVTGVFADLPDNTHLKFDALIAGPMFQLEEDALRRIRSAYTYVSIDAETDLPATLMADDQETAKERFFLRPVEDIHTTPAVSNNPEPGTDSNLLLFLALTGVIVMMLAISNYTNNTILNSFDRAKEIGLRKLMGIKPRQLVGTFVGEALLINGVAGVLAVIFFRMGVNLALAFGKADASSGIINPVDYQSIIAQNLAANSLLLLCLVSVSTLLSSLYPALYFNSLNPVVLLRGKLQIASSRVVGGASRVVRSLLVFQVAVSVFFLSGVYIVFSQLRHMEAHDKRPMELNVKAIFPGASTASPLFTVNALDRLDELIRNGDIRKVAFSNLYEGAIRSTGKLAITGLDETVMDTIPNNTLLVVDHSYWSDPAQAFVSGRNFSKSFAQDDRKVVVNEAAMRKLGVEVADSLVGRNLKTIGGTFQIIGVVREASTQAQLYVTGFAYRTYLDLVLQYPGTAGKSVHDFLQQMEILLSSPFPFISLLRREYQSQRLVEKAMLNMFLFFSAMAVFIANIGMYGLSAFITQKRAKEIGLRKILGATTYHALWVLVLDFLKLAFIGSMIAIPVVIWGGNLWLENYYSRISIGPLLVGIPALAILLISLAVVAEKCWKAAAVSPIVVLAER